MSQPFLCNPSRISSIYAPGKKNQIIVINTKAEHIRVTHVRFAVMAID